MREVRRDKQEVVDLSREQLVTLHAEVFPLHAPVIAVTVYSRQHRALTDTAAAQVELAIDLNSQIT